MENRSQLAYPLDPESLGTLKAGLPTVLKELSRVQAITLLTGTTTFDVRNTDAMSVTGNAAVTIATITNGYSGQVLTLYFNDANVTITDTGTGASGTVNLDSAFTSANNTVLQLLHDGTSWREIARSTSDIGGPATSTDNAIARWDGTTGNLLQDSVVTIADTTGNVAGLGTLNTHTLQGGTSTLAMYSNTLAVFAATTSAQLAGVISDETGTGLLVFATSPTLTTPRIVNGGFIADSSGNEALEFQTAVSAVNHFFVANAATGSSPRLTTVGDDTNINMLLQAKGTGSYIFQATTAQQTILVLREDVDNGFEQINLTVAPSLASDFTLTLPSATDTLVGKATTDTFTNKSMSETQLTFTDITTGNASTTAHGFAPKRDGLTTTFLRGDGTYAAPTLTSSFIGALTTNTSTTVQNVDTTFTTNFTPKVITIYYKLTGVSNGAAQVTNGIATYDSAGTLILNQGFVTNGTTTATVTLGTMTYDATVPTAGSVAGTHIVLNLSINSTSSTNFVVRAAFTAQSGNPTGTAVYTAIATG